MKIDVQKHQRKSAFLEVSKTFIVRVVGGWVGGWTVDSLGPSIFLNFTYVKNYVMKLLNIYKKFVPTNFLWV